MVIRLLLLIGLVFASQNSYALLADNVSCWSNGGSGGLIFGKDPNILNAQWNLNCNCQNAGGCESSMTCYSPAMGYTTHGLYGPALRELIFISTGSYPPACIQPTPQ